MLRGCLIVYFEQQFSMFKQYYMYFHTFSPTHIFKKIQTTLLEQHYQMDSEYERRTVEVSLMVSVMEIHLIAFCASFTD